MALTHHDTAHRNQAGGPDAILFSAEHRGDHNIAAGPQTTIGPQCDLVAKIVQAEHLMRFSKAHFPRQAGIFDTGLRRSTGAANTASDQDDVGLRLRHTSRNRSDSRLGHELHTNAAIWVDLLQIVDQLRQILDRIDVVVRRWANQRHARC